MILLAHGLEFLLLANIISANHVFKSKFQIMVKWKHERNLVTGYGFHTSSLSFKRRTKLQMGRSYVRKVPPLAVATFAFLTLSSALPVTSTISPSSQSFQSWAFSSFTRTISPTERLRSRFCHFDRLWRFCRYCQDHLIQN